MGTTCDESYLTVTGSSVECTNHNFAGSNCTITCNLAGTAYGFDYSGASSGESSGEPPVGEELYDEEQQEYDQEYDYSYDSYVSRHKVVCGPDGAWTDERPVCLPDVNFTYDDDDDSSLNYDDFLEQFGEQELERPLETSDQRDLTRKGCRSLPRHDSTLVLRRLLGLLPLVHLRRLRWQRQQLRHAVSLREVVCALLKVVRRCKEPRLSSCFVFQLLATFFFSVSFQFLCFKTFTLFKRC